MIGKLIGKKLLGTIAKQVLKDKVVQNIQKYVEEPNEVDIQVKQLRKVVNRQGMYIEELEKDVAILKRDSHPPIVTKGDYRKLEKRINKIEKREIRK